MLSLCALGHATTAKLPYNISECSFVCLQLSWCGAHISERGQCRRRPGNSVPNRVPQLTLSLSGLPSHQLRLKVNSPIMLMRNLEPANGTRLVVKRLQSNVINAEICTGRHSGKHVLIPRIALTPSDNTFPFTLRRRQFPVRAAFAMTINKSQGQTLDAVGLFLPEPVFTHGHVDLSRARSFKSITVLTNDQQINADGSVQYRTRNIVYSEVL